MGNDLVERLKNKAAFSDRSGAIYLEAAARILELEEALKPMAELAAAHEDVSTDLEHCTYPTKLHITVGDLRRAARALETKPNPAKG